MKLYCYHIAPIDYWFGALTADQINTSVNDHFEPNHRKTAHEEVTDLKNRAEAAFRTIGWEGDVREGPFYFAVPGDTQMLLGYVLKQDNNGNCFVASPVPLPAASMSIFEQTTVE